MENIASFTAYSQRCVVIIVYRSLLLFNLHMVNFSFSISIILLIYLYNFLFRLQLAHSLAISAFVRWLNANE